LTGTILTLYNGNMQAAPPPYRAMREATGLTLSAVARAIGINKGRLSIIERGVPPTDEERAKLNAYLGERLTHPETAA